MNKDKICEVCEKNGYLYRNDKMERCGLCEGKTGMTTQQKQSEKTREQIVDIIHNSRIICDVNFEDDFYTNQILSLSVGRYKLSELIKLASRGNVLAELDEKQELPEPCLICKWKDTQGCLSKTRCRQYQDYTIQQNMKNEYWKKTIPQEE